MKRSFLVEQPLLELKTTECHNALQIAAHSGVIEHLDPSIWTGVPRSAFVEWFLNNNQPERHGKRTALIADAGFGKSENLRWLCAQINDHVNGRYPIVAVYARQLPAHLETTSDVQQFVCDSLKTFWNESEDFLHRTVRRYLSSGRVNFLLDGLDEVGYSIENRRIRSLFSLLAGAYGKNHVCIAGRPHAFVSLSNELSQNRYADVGWKVYRVGQLDVPEARQILATRGILNGALRDNWEAAYENLGEEGQRLSRIPRFGILLSELPDRYLETVKSGAAIYWKAYSYVGETDRECTGLIDSALRISLATDRTDDSYTDLDGHPSRLGFNAELARMRNDAPPNRRQKVIRRWQRNIAFGLLSSIAFEMLVRNAKYEQGPQHYIVESTDFHIAIATRCERAKACCYLFGEVISRWNLLNEELPRLQLMNSQGLKFATLSEDGVNGSWRFVDPTTHAFFAAYWLLIFFGNEDDIKVVSSWIPNPKANLGLKYQEFWDMAVNMPVEEILAETADSTHQHQDRNRVFNCIFDRQWQLDPDRPVRSTELMHRLWDRMQGSEAVRNFQSEAEVNLREGCSDQPGLQDIGSGLVFDVVLVELPSKKLFVQKYCVTNGQYIQFDPSHHVPASHHEDAKISAERLETFPVANVSYYDAWAFAKWVGRIDFGGEAYFARIPTDEEWEQIFHIIYHKSIVDEIRINTRESGRNGPISVFGDGEITCDNPFGISQMLGNVAEWVETEQSHITVIRGGSYADQKHKLHERRPRKDRRAAFDEVGFRLVFEKVST